MATFTLTVNNEERTIEAPEDMSLLWTLRDVMGLTGTKYGCGTSLCGSCTVHLNGQPIRSCQMTIAMVSGQVVTTIEGLSEDGTHPVQVAWNEHNVPQCGYCQAGQIMSGVIGTQPQPDIGGH